MPEKYIIVTGAGKGIGFSLTKKLLEDSSCLVFAISRNRKQLLPLSDIFSNLETIEYDLLNSLSDPKILVKQIEKKTSRIDVIVNNAGLLLKKPFSEMSTEEARKMLETNVLVPGILIRSFLPLLKKSQHPHIVNIGSMGGVQGSVKFPGLHYYSASKGALAVLTECLAEELKPDKISVNCLALGSVQTEMLAQAFPDYQAPLTAEDMASLIAEFALNGYRFFNGKIIPVSSSVP